MSEWEVRSDNRGFHQNFNPSNEHDDYDETQLDEYSPIHITPELKPDPREMVEEDLNIAPEWAYDHKNIIHTDFQFGAIIDRPKNRAYTSNKQHNNIITHEEYEAKYNKTKNFYTSLHSNNKNYPPSTSNPHGNLSISQLQNINIRHTNACYIKGLPIHIAKEHILRQNKWFGSFGKIIKIIFPQSKQDKLLSSQTVCIIYDNNISASNAINFCTNTNLLLDNPNRKIKATYGMQQYCLSFLQNIECKPECGLTHSWCTSEDVITKHDINQFRSIPYGIQNSDSLFRPLPNAPIMSSDG
eukprot:522202_1